MGCSRRESRRGRRGGGGERNGGGTVSSPLAMSSSIYQFVTRDWMELTGVSSAWWSVGRIRILV